MKLALFLVSALCLLSPVAHAQAVPGQAAPSFTLPDTLGKKHSLSDFKGKYVVLEWINHECPFVRKHYNTGNMQKLQAEYTAKGVIWLSINSAAEGKEGYTNGEDALRLTVQKKASPTAVLLDPEGTVGRAYGAKTTPHMFVITPAGTVIYAGAIDDNDSTREASIESARNYVAAALEEALAGKAVTVSSTKSYGCSVKYKS